MIAALRHRSIWLLVVSCAAALAATTVAGCGAGPTEPSAPAAVTGQPLDGDFGEAGQVPGALSSANMLPTIDRRLSSGTSLAARIVYTSTSGITGALTQVTGSVFVPPGSAPQGGWPILAFGHSTTGIRPACAPSLSPSLLGAAEAVRQLVKAGYVVTVPDYQGLGSDRTYHPYLDATTAGYNMIDAVRATRKLVPAAGDHWAALGISQGGQASWAANELAADYGKGLSLVGSVSVAPPADITGFAPAAEAGQLTSQQLPALQLILAALSKEHPGFPLDEYRRGIVAQDWDLLTACRGPDADRRARVIDQITPDDLRPADPAATQKLLDLLGRMSLPKSPATAPMLVMYGGRDQLIPAAWTQNALAAACAMGDVIDIRMAPDKGHDDLDWSPAVEWVSDRFAGVPAPNSCPAGGGGT